MSWDEQKWLSGNSAAHAAANESTPSPPPNWALVKPAIRPRAEQAPTTFTSLTAGRFETVTLPETGWVDGRLDTETDPPNLLGRREVCDGDGIRAPCEGRGPALRGS